MTARQIFRLALRRWYVVVSVGVATMGVLAVSLAQPPVYYTRFELVLLAPVDPQDPNRLRDPIHPLAPLAGVLVHDVNDESEDAGMASTDTTLYGEGLRRGARVRAPSTGTQWQPVYTLPNLIVDVVDDDPATVDREATRLTAEVRESLERRQDELLVAQRSRVRLLESPYDPVIVEVGGSRLRAAVAIAAVGASAALALVYWLELLLGRRRRRARAADQPQEL